MLIKFCVSVNFQRSCSLYNQELLATKPASKKIKVSQMSGRGVRAHWGIVVLLVSVSSFAVSVCGAEEKTAAVEVVGRAECADCKVYDIKSTQPFSGLRISFDCKLENGETKRIGEGDINDDGKFKISIVHEPKQNCYAQLHSAAAVPCPAQNGLAAAKIVLKSQSKGVKTFGPAADLQFSTVFCASKTFLPHFHYPPLPPLSPHPWLKKYKSWPPLPPLSPHPWLKNYKSWPPLPPLSPHPLLKNYKSWPPLPPLSPHPLLKNYKSWPPLPPLSPHPWFKHPPSPVYAPPLPPPAPIYEPNPPVPVYNPKPKPSVPVHKHVHKPKQPVYTPAPEVKPLPKLLPPLPKIPPKYFHHPKFGFNFPPLPPHHP